MPNVSLTPELEGFAESCVASGRYGNVSEVMRAALRLLQQQEEKRAAFTRMLDAAERCMIEHGYEQSTMQQIAAEAGCATGTGGVAGVMSVGELWVVCMMGLHRFGG